MSNPTPPSTDAAATPTTPTPVRAADLPYYGTPAYMHHATIAAAVLAPIGLLLPPRTMGLRTLVIVAGGSAATSQLVYDYTGQSLYQRFRTRANNLSEQYAQDLPPVAQQRQAALRAERERRRLLQEQQQQQQQGGEAGAASATSSQAGIIQRVWMGDEKEDWVKERAQRERETLESGGGYWDLIMGQINEVVAGLLPKGKGVKDSEAGQTAADAEAQAVSAETKPAPKK